jgi:DNA-binding transcriptional LysR family regulator
MHGTEFAELNAFIAVAERRSFGRAATSLGIAPSTISQIIRTLEERLGVRLLNRTTRSVSLTDVGERLLARIRPAIAELDGAVEDLNAFRDTPTGTLRLNVSSVASQIVLAPRINAFLEAYPAISLDITIDDGQPDLPSGRFDAGIRVGRLVARDMQIVRMSKPSRLMAVAAPAYLQRNPAPMAPQDLQKHNCIRLRTGNRMASWDFAKGKSRIEMSVSGSLVVNSMHLMMRATLDGVGIGYMIESYAAAHIARGELVPLLTDWSPEHESYYLYYAGRRQLPVPLTTFIAFMRQQIGS